MRINLLACGSIDPTTEDGAINGEDFHEGLTMRTGDEEHFYSGVPFSFTLGGGRGCNG